MEIFDDLEGEEERLEAVLGGLTNDEWTRSSAAIGWTVADVVVHLALGEEAVVATATGREALVPRAPDSSLIDEVMDRAVRAEEVEREQALNRWITARRTALGLLRRADPGQPLGWVVGPLKPKVLATTRLADHWAHGLDITGPLGIPFPDTERLYHIAWLAHRSLPYGFSLIGETPHEVFCELLAPDGTMWRFGPPGAESTISGTAGALCRVGARRLEPEESGLVARGPQGFAALRALRFY